MHPQLHALLNRHGGRCSQPFCRRPLGRKSGGRVVRAWRFFQPHAPRGVFTPENLQVICTACLDGLKQHSNCPAALSCAIARHDSAELNRRFLPRAARGAHTERSSRTRGLAAIPSTKNGDARCRT